MLTPETQRSLARNLFSGFYVAARRAAETGSPYAYDVWADAPAGGGTTGPASEPPGPGFDRLAVIGPDDTPEEVMGICKRVATARQLGDHVALEILQALGPHLVKARERDRAAPQKSGSARPGKAALTAAAAPPPSPAPPKKPLPPAPPRPDRSPARVQRGLFDDPDPEPEPEGA